MAEMEGNHFEVLRRRSAWLPNNVYYFLMTMFSTFKQEDFMLILIFIPIIFAIC